MVSNVNRQVNGCTVVTVGGDIRVVLEIRGYIGVIIGLYWGYIKIILGLY